MRLGRFRVVRVPSAVAIAVSVPQLGRKSGIIGLQPLTDTYLEPAAPAPYCGDIDRQNDKPQGDHPEAQDRQETHKTEEDKNDANQDPQQAASRQFESPPGDFDLGHG